MTTRSITAPTTEPIDTLTAKGHLRVDHSDDDDLIDGFVTSAREQCEHILGRSIMPQTWELVLDAFPSDNDIELLYPSIIAITSIKYVSADTLLEVSLAPDQYVLDKDSEPGWLLPANGSWPATADVANAVRIRYTAGYADAASVPASIKNWIKLAVGVWYRNREAGVEAAITTLPHDFFSGLLDRYRIWRL